MACGCSKQKTKFNLEKDAIYKEMRSNVYRPTNKIIDPFETCQFCALKHLGYAIVLINDFEELRGISQIYLAYKHLEKSFKEEAKKCFEIITDYFYSHIDINKLEELIKDVQKLTELKEEVDEDEGLNLEKNLDLYFRSALYILAAIELFNYEVGYQDINTPFVIGLLQKAAEKGLESDLNFSTIQESIRNVWKNIETNNFFDTVSLTSIAERFIEIQRYELNKNK